METQSTSVPLTKAENLSLICIAAIDEILEQSRKEGIEANDDFVHQVRVLTKQLRAAWNMVRGMVPIEEVKERRAALRAISGRFSGSRDQAVLQDLWSKLAEGNSFDQESPLQSADETNQPTESQVPGSLEYLREELQREKQAWLSLDWNSKTESHEILNMNAEKSYRKARKATRKARKSDCAAAWHAWRKAIKQLRYQREFLAELEGRALSDFEMKISHLGTLLGKRNDLDNLEKYVKSRKDMSKTSRKSVHFVIDESTGKIMKKCRRLGKKLFGKKSSS